MIAIRAEREISDTVDGRIRRSQRHTDTLIATVAMRARAIHRHKHIHRDTGTDMRWNSTVT